ncbi:MAG: PLP-dependent aminotransferase family protein [Clostridia bacterium]|nr:PLP-dependent aminotransferase family protein [Clostridia bacterium]
MNKKKYLLLYRTLKEKIITGQYDKKLPSKRTLADRTGYSVITVEKAYQMLIDEGYLCSRERSGYFITKPDSFPLPGEKNIVSFPPLEEPAMDKAPEFEYDLWFKTVRKVISDRREQLLLKSPNKGCAVLRNAIAAYLLRYRGMVANPKQIIIGSGSEQLYETVVKLLGRDKIFGIENPSYRQIEAVYTAEGVTIKKLPMAEDGISDNALSEGGFDVLHVTPFRSYPTGVTASAAKRYQYIKWAKASHYIVEDDFNSEFFLPGNPIESLYSIDQKERVIYINTFSKSLSPSMRMGYLILPGHLLSRYEEVLGNFSCTVPVLDQYILAEFIESGNFERHLNRMRRKMNQTK